jgi:serine/threonine protein kinase
LLCQKSQEKGRQKGCSDKGYKKTDHRRVEFHTRRSNFKSTHQKTKSFIKLSHKNIVETYDSFLYKDEKENTTYFCKVMEFCESNISTMKIDSEKVKKQITKGVKKSNERILQRIKICKKTFNEKIHSNNIIHKNIKPENILLKDNVIKIADFGLPQHYKDTKKPTCYMAPEIWKAWSLNQKPSFTQSADIFSSIITFYILYTQKELQVCLGEKIIEEGHFFSLEKYINRTNLVLLSSNIGLV